jgi:hypothetical protein
VWSADFFNLFRANVLHGRAFTSDEDRPGGGSVAILSYSFGQPTLAVTPALSAGGSRWAMFSFGRRRTEPRFDTEQFDPRPDVWVPFQIDSNRVDGGNLFLVTGRLKPQANIATANALLMAASQASALNAANTRTTWRSSHCKMRWSRRRGPLFDFCL